MLTGTAGSLDDTRNVHIGILGICRVNAGWHCSVDGPQDLSGAPDIFELEPIGWFGKISSSDHFCEFTPIGGF